MTIYQRMASIFETAEVETRLNEWRPTTEGEELPEVYAVYTIHQSGEAIAADDEMLIEAYDIFIDLYGVRDLTESAEAIKAAMEGKRFTQTYDRNFPVTRQTRYIYHRQLRLVYYDDFTEE